MKIEIKHISNQYKFYDEVYGIMKIYLKKLYNNPYKKIVPLTRIYQYYCLFSVLAFLYTLFFVITTSFSSILLICTGIIFTCLLISIVNLIHTKKAINILANREIDSILSIDKDKIFLENKIVGQKNELLWSDIHYILVGHYSIGFMPKKGIDKRVAIYCSIDSKKEINKVLEKYQKQELIKENKNLKRQ